jgi:hypothetical protein
VGIQPITYKGSNTSYNCENNQTADCEARKIGDLDQFNQRSKASSLAKSEAKIDENNIQLWKESSDGL